LLAFSNKHYYKILIQKKQTLSMQAKITSLLAFFIFFLLSGTTQTHAQSVAPCKKYTVASTQNVCGCSDNRWAPYAMAIGTPQSSCTRNLFKPQDLTFQQNGNGTATLSGTLRNNTTWQLVVVNITLTDETTSGSPKLELCNEGKSRSIAESWMYYTKARGTIQIGNTAPLSIQLGSTAFQVGKGANGQNTTELGASGVFNLNETTTVYLNFNLTNGQSCTPTGGGTDNGNGNSNIVSCDSIKFKTNNNAIVISNVNAPNADVQIFDKNWNKLYTCSGSNCQTTRLTNLPAGDYVAKIKMFSNNPWMLICSNDYRLKVTSDSTVINPPNPCAKDTTLPSINCPQNILTTISNTTENCVKVTWAIPTATDNCSTPSVSSTYKPNDCFEIGGNLVVYTATDSAGNKANCTFTITVNRAVINPCSDDKILPIITCPTNISANITNAVDSCIKVTWANPTATDNCSTPSVSSTYKPNDCFKIGVNTVVYTATDSTGNKANCTFTVTVRNTDTCQLYDAKESNLNCGCADPIKRYTPYFLYFGASPTCNVIPSNTFDIRFRKNPDGTGVISGNGRDSAGNLVSLNIRITGFSRTGTPRLELCNDTAQVPTNTWYYYTGLTGTITFGIQGSPIGISLNGGAFQVGVGADGQNYLILGGSGRIKLSDGREGGLSFQFSNIQSCLSQTNPLASNNTALLSLFAHAEYQRARIEWVNNTGYKNDFFVVQKLNTQGEFVDIHVTNSILPTRELQYFTFYDNNPTEGENAYRIKLDYNDGTVRYSEIKKLNFKDVNSALIFPNPASDFVNIGLPQLKGKNANIYVYNSFGQQILFQTVENVGDVPVRMDISKFTTGNFLIRITAKGKRDMMKTLIITR
jgi:HYR domain/Secretion system C-terminal sorting domain